MAVLKKMMKLVVGLVIIVMVYLGVFVGINQIDVTPNATLADFLGTPPAIANKDNGYLALLRLHAPVNAQDKAYRFIGDAQSLECWTLQQPEADKPCASEAALNKMIADNKVLLDRLHRLSSYPHFVQNGIVPNHNYGAALMTAEQLKLAWLVLNARHGNAEIALDHWISNMAFIERLYTGRQDVVSQSITLIIRKMSLDALPLLVKYVAPKQLLARQKQLTTLLSTPAFGEGGWNIKGTMAIEYSLLDVIDKGLAEKKNVKEIFGWHSYGFYLPGATRNLYYDYASSMVGLSEMPPTAISESEKMFDEKKRFGFTWYDALYNANGKVTFSQMLGVSELLLNARTQESRMKLLKLYVDAKAAGIKAADMPAFISKAGQGAINPLSGEPFEWNAQSHTLELRCKRGGNAVISGIVY